MKVLPRLTGLAFLVGVSLCASWLLPATLLAEQGDDNPTGVAGVFNGNSTTAGNFDPYTGNAMRGPIDDIVIPASAGAYPLKWTRYFNSHVTHSNVVIGGWWRYSYLGYGYDYSGKIAYFPDGRSLKFQPKPYGVPESIENPYPQTLATLHLADGGQVIFPATGPGQYKVSKVVDPYGLETTIVDSGSGSSKTTKITEPGGRYLLVSYRSDGNVSQVQGFDGVNSQPIQSVTYTWTTQTLSMPNGSNSHSFTVLTRADYSDGTSATYTYIEGNYPVPICTYPYGTDYAYVALLATADDTRYTGAMRQIKYQYYGTGNKTRISSENNFTGEAVSTITGVGNNNGTTTATETRGDGPTRTFNYYDVNRCQDCPPPDTGICMPPEPTDGKLQNYTDFLGHTTTLTYETDATKPSAGYITAVTDANGNTTTYTRSNLSWGILRVTYPPTPSEPQGSHIDQTYTDEAHPYYLASRTDELQHTTTYTRDANNRITRKDYPAGGDEKFTYNNFNEVLMHQMTSGGTESFAYDTRGLKTTFTDALGNVTTYTYYTSGPWTDRIQTVTYPVNASGFVATETYDYDRAYDANGQNSGLSTAQAPVAGRGLVTRITHADGTYQSVGYDKYGNKLWQEDELRHRTSSTYDAYKRVLTTTDPLGHTTTNNYVPTGKTSSWITTSSLPFYTTLPSTKKTTFYYDANWRKKQVQQAPGTADEANTYFTYDNVGNQLTTKDPRGNVTTNAYDNRNRLTSTTDALSHATSFTYDAHSNKLTETHANGEVITFDTYDPMNRLTHKTVQRDNNTPPTLDVTQMTYDYAGNLHTFTDEDRNVYTYSYDLMNRLTSMIYPNALHEDTSYDAAGNVATYKNRAGAVKTFSQFDNRNRSHYFSWNDGSTPWQSTSYDDVSRVTQIANSVSTINNTYLNDNHLSTQEEWTSAFNDNVHRTVTYTYDVDGNRLTVQYPSGTAFNYTYTNRNQVASIKPGLSGGTAVVSYAFDPSGNITTRTLDNGTSTAYTVDAVNRDTAVAHNLVGGAKRFDYAYNSVNDITAVQRDSGAGDGFTYDLTQQILGYAQNGTVNLGAGTVTNPATNTNLTFDGCGNRTTLNSVNQTFNNMNQLTGTGIAYGSKGNLITYNGWTYTYDAQNRLTNATNGTTTASFYYDAKNRQIARSINNVKTFSVWDDWELIEEYGTSNVRTAAYLQGAHGPVKSLLDNIYFYQDELGSTSHIASSTGALLEYYKYDLNGKPTYFNASGGLITASAYNIRDLFSGERFVTELGLYDLRNRFMSPDLGRFLQPDPIGFKGDASNLYRYCGNDWANRADPMGTLPAEGDQNTINNPLYLKLQRDAIHEDQQQQKQQQSISIGPKTYWGWKNDKANTVRLDPNNTKLPNISREGDSERAVVSAAPLLHRSQGIDQAANDLKILGQLNYNARMASTVRFANAVENVVGTYAVAGVGGMAAAEMAPAAAAPQGARGVVKKVGIEVLKFTFRWIAKNEGPPPTRPLPPPPPTPIEGPARPGIGNSPMFDPMQLSDDQ